MDTKLSNDLTLDVLTEEWLKYNHEVNIRHNLRFGQYICNLYLLPKVSWPSLYYEVVNGRAYNIVLSHLVGGL